MLRVPSLNGGGPESRRDSNQLGSASMTNIQIQPYVGQRAPLLPLFRLADESDVHIRTYWELGDILVALECGRVAGMIQIFNEGAVAEIVSLAVDLGSQRRGIGTALIETAKTRCRREGVRRLIVGTGAWEEDNIAFYERRGFRVFNVARNFFTSEKGYDREQRDQVQLQQGL